MLELNKRRYPHYQHGLITGHNIRNVRYPKGNLLNAEDKQKLYLAENKRNLDKILKRKRWER